jgi:hypothetical protein
MKQRKLRFSSLEKLCFSRRAQGLPLNTIILAALGLIVLVIIAFLVQNQITKSSKGIKQIEENMCEPDNEIKPIGTDCDIIYASFKDLKTGFICCRKGTVK